MLRREIINHRQMAWLIGSVITAGGFVSMQNELIRINQMDAWFCYILPVLYSFGVCYILYCLSKRFPGKNLFDIVFELCGRWIGGAVNLLLIFHIWLILQRDINAFSKFTKTVLLPNTPDEIIIFVFALLLLYFGRMGLEPVARTNDIFFPLFVGITLLLPLTLTNEIDMGMLQPFLVNPPSDLLTGNMLAVGWYGDVFIAGAFLHTIASSSVFKSSLRHGIVAGTLLLIIFIVMELIVLGTRIPGNTLYPNYVLVQQIHLTDFLDRVDLIMLSIWFFVSSCKVLFIYLALLIGVSSYTKEKNYRLFNKPVCMFLIITSIMAFRSTSELFSFGNYGSILIVAAYQPLVFGGLGVWARVSKRGNGQSAPPASETAPQLKLFAKLAAKRSLPFWGWTTNALLLIAIGCIVAGLIFNKVHYVLGFLCAVGFGLCILLVLLTSWLELVRSTRYSER